MDHELASAVAGCAAAHVTMSRVLGSLTDDQCREPSRLPGWTRGHLLTHLARNADSVVRRIEGAIRDEVLDQYVGGAEGRAAEIESGAARGVDELIEDARRTADAVDAAFTSMPELAWTRLGRAVSGTLSPVSALPLSRWFEVEVHLVDLDIGYTPRDWSDALVERRLPDLVRRLPRRTDDKALMAWLLDRAAPPELGAW